ncbi:hypothetical protein YWY31_04660 [Paenibacillus illinoisensis]|uniref:YxiG family protein n=1 Tax=Paenibacillus illinoisensis TaxID=59845 RepID=UPI0034C268F8
MDELKMQLNQLWSGIIKNINFDLLNGELSLEIKVIENGMISNFDIIFQEVSAHYFIRNNGESRLTTFLVEQGDYLELSSIDYFSNGIGEITIHSKGNEWVNQYFSSANFVLEIWSSILFIEAKKMIINGITYNV